MEIQAEDLTSVYALSPHQQLTYWTGAIAQNDVALEIAVFRLALDVSQVLQIVHRKALPRGFERLRETAKELVHASRIPEALKSECLRALGRAKVAHKSRVDLVHDMWGLEEGSDPPHFIIMDALMGRGWPEEPLAPRTLSDFEAVAKEHIQCLHELGRLSMEVSRFFMDEATAAFVATQIAIHLVGGPFDNQYRAAIRKNGAPPELFTENGATYRNAGESYEPGSPAPDYVFVPSGVASV